MRFLPTKRECEEDTKVLCNVFMRAVRDDLGKFNSQKWCCVTRFILESIFSKEEFTTIGDVKVLRGEISQYEMRRLSHQSTGIEEISEKTALVVELFLASNLAWMLLNLRMRFLSLRNMNIQQLLKFQIWFKNNKLEVVHKIGREWNTQFSIFSLY